MYLAIQQRYIQILVSCRTPGASRQDCGDIRVPGHPVGPVAAASFIPESWNSEVGNGPEAPMPIVMVQVPPPLQPGLAGPPCWRA